VSMLRAAPTVDTADVLILDPGDGHARSAVAAVRALAAAGYRPAVASWGPAPLAALSRDCAARVEIPRPDEAGFGEAVNERAQTLGAALVMPASDDALMAMRAPGVDLLDKAELQARADAAGIPPVPTRTLPSGAALLAAADELPYPVVVKPVLPLFPARRVNSPAELEAIGDSDVALVAQPYLFGQLHAVGGVVWGGRLVAAIHQRYVRTWPPDCGTASAAITVEPDPVLEEQLIHLLDGFEGIFQAQLAGEYLIDLNPRVYGSLPLAVAAGANLPGVLCDLSRGNDVVPHRARAGVVYRWLEGDLRNLRDGFRRHRVGLRDVAVALMPRHGTVHSVESIRDPRPMLARLRRAVSR